MKAGDIAYWDGGSVKTTPLSDWSISLGTPIGVVVIPEGFAPDGKARIVSLKYVDTNGNQSDSHVNMKWGPDIDTALLNYNRVPTTDNTGSDSSGCNRYGYLPSDKFTYISSYIDPLANYTDLYNNPMAPSPYLGDVPNPEYYKTISGYNNAFSDFNGLNNTQTLVGLGSDYVAANACWNYKDGSGSNVQWYLPAMGELGYLLARQKSIDTSLANIGGSINQHLYLWSSTEYDYFRSYYLDDADYSAEPDWYKSTTHRVRPFATI